jgi:RNA-binding protein Musashi
MDSDVGKVFVGGVSWETTEETLRQHFSSYGAISDAVIMRDRATGRARGFGFVVFSDPSVADTVVLEKHVIEGRTVGFQAEPLRSIHHPSVSSVAKVFLVLWIWCFFSLSSALRF